MKKIITIATLAALLWIFIAPLTHLASNITK